MGVKFCWAYELTGKCPHCEKRVNLMDDPEFEVEQQITVGEEANDISVECPRCHEEFKADLWC